MPMGKGQVGGAAVAAPSTALVRRPVMLGGKSTAPPFPTPPPPGGRCRPPGARSAATGCLPIVLTPPLLHDCAQRAPRTPTWRR